MKKNYNRRFVIGDIHGEYDLFIELLKKVKFDYEKDLLICLGDVVDRGLKSYEVVEELLKIKNLISIKGNHDECFRESQETGINILYNQGGRETMLSYSRNTDCDNNPTRIPIEHKLFFNNQLLYYIDEENNLFIHGGFNRHILIEEELDKQVFYWDRDLFMSAMSFSKINSNHLFKTKNNFKTIFIGHTPTVYWNEEEEIQGKIIVNQKKPITNPIKAANIWNIDTGCGKGDFPLTIMNIDNFEYEQIWKKDLKNERI